MGGSLFPQIFGKYVLERPIAVGGMARVFLATLRGAGGFEKKLVVKQIRAELATDEAFVGRFVAEAKTTVELSHPNIVPVYELGVEQGVYFLAMELCDGVTLAELVAQTGRVTPSEGAYVGIEICRALDYAHRKARIIHRDVTPRNVIVDEEGAIRLIDFGIAAPAFAGAKEVFGSPGHMPREQLEGGELGPSTDVFAAAALLYEAWSAVAPFRRDTPEASEKALSEPVPPLSSFDPLLAPLDDLVASAMAPEAAKRPQSAEDFSRPLRRFLADADLGDLAKKLGARVSRVKSEAAGGEADAIPEQASSPDATRTFATRPLDTKSTAPTADIATRRMNDEAASWSTGDSRAAQRRRGTLWAAFALLAVAAGLGAVWRSNVDVVGVPAAHSSSPITSSFGTEPPAATSGEPPAAREGGAVPEGVSARSDEVGEPARGRSDQAPNEEPQTGGSTIADSANQEANAATGEAPAHLRVLANPQAAVEIDGRPRGPAPIADLVLAPGMHFVRLDCAPLNEAVSQNVRLSAGERITVSGDFTGPHGRLLVRRSR
jgi:serine/threonine protein kinase